MSHHLKTDRHKRILVPAIERETLGLPPVLPGHPDDTFTSRIAWAAHRRQTESRCG